LLLAERGRLLLLLLLLVLLLVISILLRLMLQQWKWRWLSFLRLRKALLDFRKSRSGARDGVRGAHP
jgi:1,4-dihydroxy-2-naphthoate octaprenyltransferase